MATKKVVLIHLSTSWNFAEESTVHSVQRPQAGDGPRTDEAPCEVRPQVVDPFRP